jgi:hypothetical protein
VVAHTQDYMFPYDPALIRAVSSPPSSIDNVLDVLQQIDATCVDGDGLKWFNWLYSEVTSAIQNRIAAEGLEDPAWINTLDVQFATLYFSALEAGLQGLSAPGCWMALLSQRSDRRIARSQFALAGTNSHINHDLPAAIVATCRATGTIPEHSSRQYQDYSSLNATLDPLIEDAMKVLHVRLLGDALPAVSHLEDTVAAWSLSAARESAWNNAEVLWNLEGDPALESSYNDSLDGLTTVTSKTLLVPAPAEASFLLITIRQLWTCLARIERFFPHPHL